jgi:hypothetical protein
MKNHQKIKGLVPLTILHRRKPISTGCWIRDHLLQIGKDYPYNMWKLFKAQMKSFNYKPPCYLSFSKYIYMLEKLGLLRKLPRKGKMSQPKVRTAIPRQFYCLEMKKLNDPAWLCPWKALFQLKRSATSK